MKKLLLFALVIALLIPVNAFCGDLHDVQDYIYKHSPVSMDDRKFTLTGEITDVYSINVNNHWDMIVKSSDESAINPLWSEYPYFIAHFRLHLDECPFKIGDTVTIVGSVNSTYSSFAVPYIIVNTINGSEDF